MSGHGGVVRSFTVGVFTATITSPRLTERDVGTAVVEWSPRVPDFFVDFDAAQRSDYRVKLMGAIVDLTR